MSVELKMLGWSIVLGLAQVLLAVTLSIVQRGLPWHAGNRDTEPMPLTGAYARATRASHNFLETFAFFAAAVLMVMVTHSTSEKTALGAELYFWARVVYLPIYIFGIPFVRTLVWTVSIVGLVMVLSGVLG